jgi:hypothetical protein
VVVASDCRVWFVLSPAPSARDRGHPARRGSREAVEGSGEATSAILLGRAGAGKDFFELKIGRQLRSEFEGATVELIFRPLKRAGRC